MDTFSKGMKRRSINARFIKKLVFEIEFMRLAKYENLIFEYFEHHTIISDQDRRYILHKNSNRIHVIPNGVDTSFFEDRKSTRLNSSHVRISYAVFCLK